jgi:glycosyltransferase involved in cell wall biosynthesis
MINSLKISVTLCTFNDSKYMIEQLVSTIRQNRLADELVISDDCSTNDTIEIVQQFSPHSPLNVF